MKRESVKLRLNKDVLLTVKEIGRVAERNNLSAYLVGGVLRDSFLGRKNLDADIVIEKDAISFARKLARGKGFSVVVHEEFKTATLFSPKCQRVDLTTARSESYRFSGALPSVRSGSICDDLFRRDFTINAIAAVINPGRLGELVDYFGGLKDLKAKRIRVMHTKSFLDDPTRILRAVRFEQRFDFRIERRTLKLLKTALKKDAIGNVKPPRFFAELRKILNEKNPEKCIKRLKALGCWRRLFPYLSAEPSVLSLFDSIRKNILWCEKNVSKDTLENWFLFFMALAKEIKPQRLEGLASSIHIKKEQKKDLFVASRSRYWLKRLSKKNLKPSDVYHILKPLNIEAVVFLRSLLKSKATQRRIDDFLKKHRHVQLKINGDDLKSLGIYSGTKIGDLLRTILCRKIDGRLKGRRDELRLAKKLGCC